MDITLCRGDLLEAVVRVSIMMLTGDSLSSSLSVFGGICADSFLEVELVDDLGVNSLWRRPLTSNSFSMPCEMRRLSLAD